jgi:hypothetical protein
LTLTNWHYVPATGRARRWGSGPTWQGPRGGRWRRQSRGRSRRSSQGVMVTWTPPLLRRRWRRTMLLLLWLCRRWCRRGLPRPPSSPAPIPSLLATHPQSCMVHARHFHLSSAQGSEFVFSQKMFFILLAYSSSTTMQVMSSNSYSRKLMHRIHSISMHSP